MTAGSEASVQGDPVVRSARVSWAAPVGKAQKHPITVGAIFVNSWGYEQTNVDAYQVVSVTPATVKVRRIGLEQVPGSDGFMSNRVRPVPGLFDERFTKLHAKRPYCWTFDGSVRWMLNTDYGSCELWDGARSYYCSWYA